ncbi:MAG: hypothetical protein OEZ03_05435 [Alphaproteobacteria bacterium]|nr:hypothetical protein [Alphaproteobacteria bacterium]
MMSDLDSDSTPDEAQVAAVDVVEPVEGMEPPATSEARTELDWRDTVADPDLRRQLDRYNSVEDLTRHNLALRRRLSRAVTPPDGDADEEELAEFRTRMGVPENPADYEYDPPGDLPDYLADAGNEDEIAEMFEVSHALGLTQAQLSGLLDWRFEKLSEAGEQLGHQMTRAREEAEQGLRREWGRDYDRNLNLSRRALRDFGGEGLPEFLSRARVDGTQLGNHAEIVRWAANVGRALSEATLEFGGEGGGMSSEDRRTQLTQEIHDARAAGDGARAKELDAERRTLTGRLYGKE